jgi:hypothetical protein
LALRGFVIARTGVLPTDPTFVELSRNEELLRFTAYWLQRRDEEQQRSWLRALGVTWSRDDVEAMFSEKPTRPSDSVFIPLAMAINPQIREALKQMFGAHKGAFVGGGEYVPGPGEQIVELDENVSREEFLRMARAAGQASSTAQASWQPVKVLDGEADDPRIQRIREQIAHSKVR